MSVLILVPGLISLFLILRGRIETAFLSVYLPCLLCLPHVYGLRLPHLPPLSAAQFALIPLGIVGLSRLIRSGAFALMDLLVPLYVASIALSEILHAAGNDGLLALVDAFISIFLAYMAGRQLIEPELRLATVRRFITLLLVDGLFGLYEWRMGQSLYGIFARRILRLSTLGESVQLRNGRGRMGTVFGNSEGEGIVFAMTFCLNAWLAYLRRVQASVDLGKTLTWLEKYHVPELLLLFYLLLTQSRGPLLALAAGYLILQIPRFKSTRIMTVVVAVLLVAGYFTVSGHFASLLEIDPSTMTEQQASALYRLEMNKLYGEIAEKGGWTGWGVLEIPVVEGMKSIDNHYLFVRLAWGRLGYILLLLIVCENIRVLVTRSWMLEALEDRALVFSLLAAMVVLWVTLLTVYMGDQLPQISFLLMGWTQSILPRKAAQDRKFSFRQVFT